jgi:GT2 family glycosyltransferase
MNPASPGNGEPGTVHVLLPVHNRRELTRRFLRSLRSQTYENLRVLVIDDGSDDGTAEAVAGDYPQAIVLRGDGKQWWAGSLQMGLDYLRESDIGDDAIVFIANDDTTLDAEFVYRAVGFLSHNRGCLLCARVMDPETGAITESGVHADLTRFRFRLARSADEINCLPTRGLFLRWGDVKKIGGFHPLLLPHYWSDYEYTMRAWRRGYRCVTDDSVALVPDNKTTGYHDLDDLVGWKFITRFFSMKSPLNPWFRTVFVLLAAPGILKLVGVVNVLVRSVPRLLWQGLLHLKFPRRLLSGIPK